MNENTPGPWQQNGSHIYGPDPTRDLICRIAYPTPDEGDANGRLITAVTEMLAVLKRLDEDFVYLEKHYRGSLYTTGAGYTLQPRVLELRAVIAKAVAAAPSTSDGSEAQGEGKA